MRVERADASRSSTPAAWTSSTPTRSRARSASRRRRRSPTRRPRSSSSTRAPGAAPGRRGARRPPAPLARRPGRDRGEQGRLGGRHRRWRRTSTRSASATRSPSRPRRGSASGDLLDRVVELLPEAEEEDEDDDAIRLAVVGRPNVGKSTLVNRFLGSERVIVSDVAGTTRDAIDLPLEVDGRRVILIDTAGLRRQSKVSGLGRVLHDAALAARGRARRRRARRLRRARRHHEPGPADRRARDAGGHARPRSSSTSGTSRRWTRPTSTTSAPAWRRSCGCGPKVLTASALTGRNVGRVLAEAITLGDRMHNRIPTPRAQPLPRRARPGAPAAGQAGPPPQAALHGADRDRAAALRGAGQLAHARDARLRVLPREPPARPLRDGRRAARSSTSTSAARAAARRPPNGPVAGRAGSLATLSRLQVPAPAPGARPGAIVRARRRRRSRPGASRLIS